jgi:myo-inositol-1(or 4)-monophosphatase
MSALTVPESETYLHFAIDTARAAGQVIYEGAHRPIEVTSKGLRNLLTDVDLAAERTIVEAIRMRYPEHDILTEETPPEARSSRYQWVIDPLDGTGNFSRRVPCFCTSIALAVDDQPVVGVVYDPMVDRLYAARNGGGATLNGVPMSVTQTTEMVQTVIGMDWTRSSVTRRQNACVIAELVPVCGTVRISGSAALGICNVGAGSWDAYWHLELSAWDVAAGAVIVREAGGQVTDLQDRPWTVGEGPVLVSNGVLHDTFRGYVNQGCEQVS